jgi:leucine-rich repeat protein SHOC2
LTSLSAALGKLPALQSLEVRSNEVTSVADEIGSLQLLSYFDLAFNNLSNMPNAFKAPACQMTALAYLDLSHNKIQPIPADFFEEYVQHHIESY